MSYTASYIVNSSSAQGTTDFQFTFPYIKEEHIEVFLNYNKITQGSGSNQFQVITNVSPKLIRLNTGIASANLRVEVRRNSSLGTPLVDYADGSTLTANDLDTSALQSLYIDQELKDNQGKTVSVDEATGLPSMGESGTNLRLTNVADPTAAQDAATKNYVDTKVFTSAQIQDGTLVNADVNANAAIAGTKINPNFGDQNIVTTGTVDGRDVSVDGAKLDTCDTNAKDDQTAAEIKSLIASSPLDASHLAADSVTTSEIADSNVTTNKIAAGAVVTGRIAVGAVTNEKLADGAVNSSKLADDSITNAKIANNAVSTNEINTASIAAQHLAGGAVTTPALGPNAVTTAKIADDAVTTAKIADAELTTLAGMQSGTASILASSTALTATNAEINTVCDGKSVQTTISDTDNSYPTSGAVVDYVAAQIAPLGGLEVIANEDSFPTQPASGVVISIADAGGIVVNGSGVSTTARTSGNGSDNVTINGFPSTLYSTTLTDNMGLLVSSTGSSNTYTYHKLLGKESDIKSLSDDINDFNNRYRVAASAPSSSLDDGDLWFDTANDKMKVYNATGSSWDDVATVGDFFINTLSSSSNTGGGSATFNGTAYRFVLSSPPASAQQLIVSVNGVIQKPNAGSSQPSEGFAVSGNDIIFSAAPPSGADYFITTQGSAVSVGTPSDNTISTAKIQNLAVTGDKIATNLDLADNKKIRFGTGNDLDIFHDSGSTKSMINNQNGELRIVCDNAIRIGKRHDATIAYADNMIVANPDGAVELYWDNSKKFETTSTGGTLTGHLTVTGEVIGSDDINIPVDNKKLNLGASADLKLYHNSSNYINYSNGNLVFKNGTESDANCTQFDSNGDLYVPDDGQIYFGGAPDLKIYHQSSYPRNVIETNGKDLVILTSPPSGTNEKAIAIVPNGAVELYWDNSMKFATTTNGVRIPDDIYLGLGNSDDLNIRFLNGTGAFIQSGGENMYIRSNLIELGDNSGHKYIKCIDAGAVELYHGVDSKKLETTSTGVTVTTDLVATGNINPSADGGGNLGQPAKRWYRGYFTHGIGLNGETTAGNMLDDYEEGTWTPAYGGAVSSPTYVNTAGFYTKVGNWVHVVGRIQMTAATANNSDLTLSGFPFPASASTGGVGGLDIIFQDNWYSSSSGGGAQIIFTLSGGTQYGYFYNGDGEPVHASDCYDVKRTMHFKGSYMV